ncbi:MAG: apolipoprotein N-acyltransferase [Chitinophagaceae bacterium]|jgi:apolipoprotein N-acyltransferase|nr:apolipoprotein N-acyltransferase [Chitinophagaceae bacterium]
MNEVPFFCIMQKAKTPATAYALVLLSGFLLWLSWPHNGFTIFIFVAWIPILMGEEKFQSTRLFFLTLWASFLIWNTGTTWWIWNSTGPGAAGAIMANSLIMCLPVLMYRFCKKIISFPFALASFISYWVLYEFIHHNWELSWPWLTLGNVFATTPSWIQWYQFTGSSGGSVWVLLVNSLIFAGIKLIQNKSRARMLIVSGFLMAVIPIALGIMIYPKPSSVNANSVGNTNVVVVQPNVEPYFEKFNTSPDVLTENLIALSKGKMDANTRLLVWPETAIPAQAWEHEIDSIPIFKKVFAFLDEYPNVLLVTGIDSYKLWGNYNPGGMSIRKMRNGLYYEAFNTAMGKSASNGTQLYHKSKLVPGVESLPSWLGFMASVFDDFGGINGSLGRSDHAMVFSAKGNPYRPAPVICYESIYSDYLTRYTNQGANIITIITNDGWWGNTEGHHQHMHYARLRAIESGLWVARSANTGISCFIDPQGHIYQPQPWDTQAAIKMEVPVNSSPSFYARNFDWISRLSAVVALLLFIYTIYRKWLHKKQSF